MGPQADEYSSVWEVEVILRSLIHTFLNSICKYTQRNTLLCFKMDLLIPFVFLCTVIETTVFKYKIYFKNSWKSRDVSIYVKCFHCQLFFKINQDLLN